MKKKLEKFERDKQQWENQKRVLESKQPMDVQILQSQKRELTMQLDREQAEKQELFLQINTLIAQLAEISRDKMEQSSASLEAENEVLKNEFRNVQEIQTRLNNDVQNLQEELRLKNTEVEITRDEVKRLQILLDSERMRFEETVDGLERDLQLKAAALQNAMLAKKVCIEIFLF
ncbi:unnamed protein product [Dracunculus medinensis]|uniref:Uncharacterized protein n=1 Tax=Dracunculus medinensis TaxID=318479 RepID=A0A3P7Q1J9_DRAME|nr:unnamed protein product [Dracunculus medinensis]